MNTILIVCGAGASSTFLAVKLRALARDSGLDVTARPTSTSELLASLSTGQVLLVGAHLASAFAEIERTAADYSVPAVLLPPDALDPSAAAAAFETALTHLHLAPRNEGSPHG